MRFRLRTLLIVLALGPPMLAATWTKWNEWRLAVQEAELKLAISAYRRETGDYAPPREARP